MLDTAIVIGYIVFLVGMGLRGGRGVKNAADFTASGGRYGTAVIFATLSASYVGGGFSSGNAAEAFSSGISTTLTLLGFSVSMVIIGKYLVPGVSRFASATTVGGIMEQAYGPTARLITGFFAFLCCAGVVGAQMEAMGMVFHVVLGIPSYVGIIIGCSIVLIYTTFGGLQSVITADVIQFVVLAVGMPVLLIMGLWQAGGIVPVTQAIPPAYWNPLNGRTGAEFVSLFLTMAVGEALAPPYTQRLLIGKSARQTARATVLSGLFSVPFFLVTGGIGLVAYALQVTTKPATAMPAMILTVLPIGLRGVIMAAMVSIILSAADGFLNSASIGLVCDTILPLRPRISDRQQLRLLRIVNLTTGLSAMVLAFLLPSIFDILVLAYSFWCPLILIPLGAAFLGVKTDRRAFRNAVLVGLVLTTLWNFVLQKPWGIDGGVVGMIGNFLVFTACTRRATRYRAQTIYLWK